LKCLLDSKRILIIDVYVVVFWFLLSAKMATGLDRLLFTLTTTLIVARILAFPTQIDLPDNGYMVEDLGLYSGTKQNPSCYDFSLDLLSPRIVSEKIRHYRCLGDQFALEMQGCELQLKLLLE
jgi:hypothetical protein